MFDKRAHIAPELRGVHWLNSVPLSIHALRGNVVVLFFWDQTCIRSLCMLDYIKELHARYEDAGLIVIGVHSPAFKFAGRLESLERLLAEREITFPIIMDNDRETLEVYRNTETPAIIIVDQEGSIRAHYHGRGKQQSVERDVQVILKDSCVIDTLPLPMDALRPEEIPGVICSRETPQVYFGYLKGNIGNQEGFNPESVYAYEDPGFYLPGRFYLAGVWKSGRQAMILEQLISEEGYIVIKYEGREVYAIIGYEGDTANRLNVLQDDEFLTAENKGDDVRIDKAGRSYIDVHSPGLVHLVKNDEHAEYTLKITSQTAGIAMYSLTFIPGVILELIGKN